MLRPDEIDKIKIALDQSLNTRSFGHKRYSLEDAERIVKAINLAGYKLVKEDE